MLNGTKVVVLLSSRRILIALQNKVAFRSDVAYACSVSDIDFLPQAWDLLVLVQLIKILLSMEFGRPERTNVTAKIWAFI